MSALRGKADIRKRHLILRAILHVEAEGGDQVNFLVKSRQV